MAVIVSFLSFCYITMTYKFIHTGFFAFLMFIMGLMLGGLHHILCITCAADLGQKKALKSNKQATSTVTGIIDGMGSMGTAFG